MNNWISRNKVPIFGILMIIVAVYILSSVNFSSDRGSYYYPGGSSSISLVVSHGKFDQASTSLKDIAESFSAVIVDESRNEFNGQVSGGYTFDVPDENFDAFISQVRDLGDVDNYRLSSDKRFEENLREGYTRISVGINEKKTVFSSFRALNPVELGSTFSGSIVALVYFIVAVLPWALIAGGIYWLIKKKT